jgi:hypothetical protein
LPQSATQTVSDRSRTSYLAGRKNFALDRRRATSKSARAFIARGFGANTVYDGVTNALVSGLAENLADWRPKDRKIVLREWLRHRKSRA